MVQVIDEGGQHVEGAVSCWRGIFIANAFSKLSTARRANPTLSFILLVRAHRAAADTAARISCSGAVRCFSHSGRGTARDAIKPNASHQSWISYTALPYSSLLVEDRLCRCR